MAEIEKIPTGSLPPEKEDKVEPVEPTLLAGKFEKPEDLEKSYVELEKKFGETSGEVGQMRKTIDTLTDSINQYKSNQAPVEQAPDAPQAPDVGVVLNEVGAKYEKGDITFQEAMAQVSDITAQAMDYKSQAQIEAVKADLTDMFTSTLSERDQQTQVEQFHKDNPTYSEFIGSEDYQAMIAEDGMHDDFSAFKVWEERQKAQAMLDEAGRIRTGSEPSKTVASKPGHNVQQTNKTRTSDPAELKRLMREKLDSLED